MVFFRIMFPLRTPRVRVSGAGNPAFAGRANEDVAYYQSFLQSVIYYYTPK